MTRTRTKIASDQIVDATKMVFSDDDLNEWKDRLRAEGDRAVVTIPIVKQRALLARLEAAEKGFEALEKSADLRVDYKNWIPRLVDAYYVWRESAGK